jgi:hypothetical protein
MSTIGLNFERTVPIRKTESKKQVVLGVVYEPNIRDTDENFMTAEEIEKMAYGFMEDLYLTRIDKDHDGKTNKGVVVESFISRGARFHPCFTPAWIWRNTNRRPHAWKILSFFRKEE